MLLALAAASCGRSQPPPAQAPTLRDVAATVRRFPIDSESFVLVPDSSPETNYVPDRLPAAFREDGLHVIFDAVPDTVPPNVRLVGPPIRLLRIQLRDGDSRS